jgi:argininosuccinate lyase
VIYLQFHAHHGKQRLFSLSSQQGQLQLRIHEEQLHAGQPLAYNKDNQEDKEPLFDAIDTVRGSLMAFADMIPAS